LPDEIEFVEEVDVNAIEFRYIEQINDALIPGQQLRLEYIEPFEEEMGEGLLVHVPNVNLPQLINLNDIDIEMYVGDDGMGLGFDDNEPMPEIYEHPNVQYHALEEVEEALPIPETGMAVTEILGSVFTVAFTIGFVIYGMEQSHHERVVIMNEIDRQNAIYEDHIAYLFKTLNVTQFNFPNRSGSFKHGFNDMHTEIYTWTQRDFMGSMFLSYMMWRVDQTLKHGIIFTSPSIQQAIDFCNKLWMKYISPGVPLQIWDLDQQYIMFPYSVLKDYKGTTKISPDIAYMPMSLHTFLTSYELIMQDRLTRNQTAYETELGIWIRESHKRAPLANGLLDNAKRSWSNTVARSIAIREASSIEEFAVKPAFIDQNTISYLKQFVELPKIHMDRDHMRQFEIVEKPFDINKVFRLSTAAYTFTQIAPQISNNTKELFHAVQLPDCAIYVISYNCIVPILYNTKSIYI
jgi:hypothetical protein